MGTNEYLHILSIREMHIIKNSTQVYIISTLMFYYKDDFYKKKFLELKKKKREIFTGTNFWFWFLML